MSLVYRTRDGAHDEVVALCDWCGGRLDHGDLFLWMETEPYEGDSEPVAWRRADGSVTQSGGLVFLHNGRCDREFSRENSRLDVFFSLCDLPGFIERSFTPRDPDPAA